MTIKSTNLLKAHSRGTHSHLWHYFPRLKGLCLPMGGLEQEISELVYCLYLMEKFRFNSNDLVFFSSDPNWLRDILPYFIELYQIVVEKPIAVNVRKASKGDRRVQQKLDEELDLTGATLFSGGVDSTAGLLLMKRERRRVVLSHTKTGNRAYNRAQRVLEKSGTGLEFVVSDATFNKKKDWKYQADSVVHSRGILFLTNALLVAHSLNLPAVVLPENGPFILNIETTTADKSTRTTHPLLIEKLSEVLSESWNKKITVEVPFANWTKAEIMCSDVLVPILPFTHSCYYTQGMKKHEMCGACYSCNVRRLSAYAAGLEQFDGKYTDNLMLLTPDTASERSKLEIMHGVLRFYAQVLEKPSHLDEKLQFSYLGGVYEYKDAKDMLYRFAADLLLGAKRMTEEHDQTSFGPLGRYVVNLLSQVDSEPLDVRDQELQSLRNTAFRKLDFSAAPFSALGQ